MAAPSYQRLALSTFIRHSSRTQSSTSTRSASLTSSRSHSTCTPPLKQWQTPTSLAATTSTSTAATKRLAAAMSPRSFKMASFSSSFHSSALSNSKNKDHTTVKRPETRSCWKCGSAVPFLALQCTNPDCKVVQTLAPGANYFEILGLSQEPNFDVDLKDLRIKFFKIQQQIHPDSYSQNTKGDQIYAQKQSSLVNKAYATIKEPLSRANYILELSGNTIHESESLQETELLMEVMEARELLEEAETEEQVEELKSVNDARIKETVAGLSSAFKEMDLEGAKTLAIQLQYWIRIKNVIRDWAAGKPIVADHV
ncbi:hypothetical protein BGZ83_001317 [Gryganskiella cystojenkinii]|nr:hypothetical protein BGZ83_001317 [Gryganskiella cystojenkinii]